MVASDDPTTCTSHVAFPVSLDMGLFFAFIVPFIVFCLGGLLVYVIFLCKTGPEGAKKASRVISYLAVAFLVYSFAILPLPSSIVLSRKDSWIKVSYNATNKTYTRTGIPDEACLTAFRGTCALYWAALMFPTVALVVSVYLFKKKVLQRLSPIVRKGLGYFFIFSSLILSCLPISKLIWGDEDVVPSVPVSFMFFAMSLIFVLGLLHVPLFMYVYFNLKCCIPVDGGMVEPWKLIGDEDDDLGERLNNVEDLGVGLMQQEGEGGSSDDENNNPINSSQTK
jgi:hypothetical protein